MLQGEWEAPAMTQHRTTFVYLPQAEVLDLAVRIDEAITAIVAGREIVSVAVASMTPWRGGRTDFVGATVTVVWRED